MTKREKIVKEWEAVFGSLDAPWELVGDTIALLKEQEEVVRCKDCKHWRQLYGDKPFYSSIGCCDCDDMWRSLDGETVEVNDIRTDSDFYCGYAKRR